MCFLHYLTNAFHRSIKTITIGVDKTLQHYWRDCSRPALPSPWLEVKNHSPWSKSQQHSIGWRDDTQNFRLWDGKDLWREPKPRKHKQSGWNIVSSLHLKSTYVNIHADCLHTNKNLAHFIFLNINLLIINCSGYMSPEYAMEGLFSVKSDVYSFGVLVLEIVSGKKNSSTYHHDNDDTVNLVGHVSVTLIILSTFRL